MTAKPKLKPRPARTAARTAARTTSRPPVCPECRSPLVGGPVDRTCPRCPLPIALPREWRPIPFTLAGGRPVAEQ
jgi:hypothetical protein